MYHTKSHYAKKIKRFLDNLNRPCFEEKYLEHHKHKISALKWLLAYYEGRTYSTPKDMLESYLHRIRADDEFRTDLEWIKTLYFWEKNKTIEGF